MKKNPKKTQIVEAAARTIADKGYENASIKEIAAEAGLSAPGLIHYYFRTKEDILLEVARQSRERYGKEFGAAETDGPAERMFGSGESPERGADGGHDPEWYKLRYELFAQGLRSDALAQEVADLLEIGRGGISGVLDTALAEIGEEERDALSAILLACFDGLALQKLLQPGLDLERAYALLEALILHRYPAAE
ncbi:TetR/AcrR family transcriptional regulator [Saccharibacillus alkalitolerans]|uniref:TetR/AcrR family transcriptional regulator n=1 Tax=Saccharibacillus alkalitolerans TaxID=2705290 RepID=A0ABX0FDH4_9BACL|nr:TetR/AcrR family transcriptional regulator [Saccharibacillus alkalitolerans]NGZ76317.1 TetR/AcrR family transcriptional regulator [Saccharibacillus alkalitolerans]